MSSSSQWPDWWNWELECTSHLTERMLDREFNEVDLRTMLADASRYRDEGNGRFVVFAVREGRS